MLNFFKAVLIKDNQPVKSKYHVVTVKPNDKYGYFEFTTKIYHHEFIEIVRYNECDKVELYYENEKSPFKVVERSKNGA